MIMSRIRFGTRNFGDTLEVPGLFYVTTTFFHLGYLPLCPEKTSNLVLTGSISGRIQKLGVEIPLNEKSVRTAYVIGLCKVLCLVSIMCIGAFSAPDQNLQVAIFPSSIILLGSLSLVLFLKFSESARNASYEDAIELCSHVNASPPEHFPGLGLVLERAVNEKFDRPENSRIPLANAPVVEEDEEMIQMINCENENVLVRSCLNAFIYA